MQMDIFLVLHNKLLTTGTTETRNSIIYSIITCARSPSYLNSQTKSVSWNLFKILATELVDFAFIGSTGTPTVKLQVFGRFHIQPDQCGRTEKTA